MDEAAREQQREARRQKVLARSQKGRAPVVDLAAQGDIAPHGVMADRDEWDDNVVPSLIEQVSVDDGKSEARLAAERRRKRILSKQRERMAKVQGDRQGSDEAEGKTSTENDNPQAVDAVDEMLDEAVAEVLGDQPANASPLTPSEDKPSGPAQPHFKTTLGTSGERASITAPLAERKTGGTASPGVKQGGNRRPAGNKLLDKQSFDPATVQSLANAGVQSKMPALQRKHSLGSIRFWSGAEAFTKAFLLLLVGASVGGLVLHDGRAAIVQSTFVDSANKRDVGGPSQHLQFDEVLVDPDDILGGDNNDPPTSSSSGTAPRERGARAEGDDESGRAAEPVSSGEDMGSTSQITTAEQLRSGAAGDAEGERILSTVYHKHLAFMDGFISWAHLISSRVMPTGIDMAGRIPCVPALFLAIMVNLLVAPVFVMMRIVVGLPMYPLPSGKNKPGMVMGMVLGVLPTLGKVLAFGNTVKSLLSDTSLLLAGTLLALAIGLSLDDDSRPRQATQFVFNTLWAVIGDESAHVGDKEL